MVRSIIHDSNAKMTLSISRKTFRRHFSDLKIFRSVFDQPSEVQTAQRQNSASAGFFKTAGAKHSLYTAALRARTINTTVEYAPHAYRSGSTQLSPRTVRGQQQHLMTLLSHCQKNGSTARPQTHHPRHTRTYAAIHTMSML